MSPLESTEQCHIKVINQFHLSVYTCVSAYLTLCASGVYTDQTRLSLHVSSGPCGGNLGTNAMEETQGVPCLFPMQWKRPKV